MSARGRGKPRRWYERKHVAWQDGYEILLRVEAVPWQAQARDTSVQAILDHCRRAVLVEMGYAVEEQPDIAAESKAGTRAGQVAEGKAEHAIHDHDR